ncbi:MAG: hypothetical protein ACXQTY_07610 [Candidatus Methanogasteraceae archaeon]
MDVAGALLYRSVELGMESVGIGREMLGKQDQMLDKQDVHTHVLTEFRDQTHQNFDVLDVKYGNISDNVERAIDEMRDERKELRASVNKLTDAIVELARSMK